MPVTNYNIINNPDSKALLARKEAILNIVMTVISLLQSHYQEASPLASNHLPYELLLSIVNMHGDIYAHELGIDNSFTTKAISTAVESTKRIGSERMKNHALFTIFKEVDDHANTKTNDIEKSYRCIVS